MASDPFEPVSRFYSCMRLQLHYLDWGNEGAPPLILMHGGRDHAHSWDWTARALRDDFHVIAPDLRGHGDSGWAPDGNYSMLAHVLDLAELVDQLQLAPVPIVAHSLGAAIALRYAAIYPANVRRIVAIEGMGGPPVMFSEYDKTRIDQRIRTWIEDMRRLVGREPRRYASLDEAQARMAEENRHLSSEQAHHLTIHGARRNEDGSYSWKFDNLVRSISPIDLTPEQRELIWQLVECPALLINGTESWASNPAEDGRLKHFQDARVSVFEGAGHWVHHDQIDRFIAETRAFLAE